MKTKPEPFKNLFEILILLLMKKVKKGKIVFSLEEAKEISKIKELSIDAKGDNLTIRELLKNER